MAWCMYACVFRIAQRNRSDAMYMVEVHECGLRRKTDARTSRDRVDADITDMLARRRYRNLAFPRNFLVKKI